jgi:hypothetical protein
MQSRVDVALTSIRSSKIQNEAHELIPDLVRAAQPLGIPTVVVPVIDFPGNRTAPSLGPRTPPAPYSGLRADFDKGDSADTELFRNFFLTEFWFNPRYRDPKLDGKRVRVSLDGRSNSFRPD